MTDEDQINVILVEMRLMGVHPKWLKVIKSIALPEGRHPDLIYAKSMLSTMRSHSLQYYTDWRGMNPEWDDD